MRVAGRAPTAGRLSPRHGLEVNEFSLLCGNFNEIVSTISVQLKNWSKSDRGLPRISNPCSDLTG
jgi:hypothetical protein